MELIIVILFFSISAVVCVQLFVNAYSTNESTKKVAQSSVIVQNLAEQFLGCEGDLDAVVALNDPDGLVVRAGDTEGSVCIGYNENWIEVPAEADHPVYVASISVTDASGHAYTADTPAKPGDMMIATVEIRETASDTCIASQEVKYHVPYRLEAGR